MPALPSRSVLLAVAVALCVSARAEDTAAVASPGQTERPAPPPGSGEGSAKPKTASIAVEEDPTGEEFPPAPAGEERRLIGDYIRNHTREIRDCYEKRLHERKTLQGKLVARFDIGPSGRVVGATADGMGDRELMLCVVRVIRGWEFDKPQSGGKLRVAYPWVFTPTPSQ
jgi:outer membrane biosynthesis protein TonB